MKPQTLGLWIVLLALFVLAQGGGIGGPVAPTTDPKLRVLITEESDADYRAKLTSGQRLAMDATDAASLKAYVESKGGEFRVLDKDDDATYLADPWKAIFAIAPKDDGKLPWVQICKPPTYYEGPLPASVDETLALAKKYGGA